MAIPAARLDSDKRFELVVSEEGLLPISEGLRVALNLELGEPVALERSPASLSLEPFNAYLDALQEMVPIEQVWKQIAQSFLTRALTRVEERGLAIPEDLFPLQAGESVFLQVHRRGLVRELNLSSAHHQEE